MFVRLRRLLEKKGYARKNRVIWGIYIHAYVLIEKERLYNEVLCIQGRLCLINVHWWKHFPS